MLYHCLFKTNRNQNLEILKHCKEIAETKLVDSL